MILNIVSEYPKFAFFGAQVVAYGAYVAIRHLLGRTPECFVVSNPDGNPPEIDGLPVLALDMVSPDTLVVIAVTELLQDEICAALQSRGYRHTFRLTAAEEHMLMSEYYASIGRFPPATISAHGGAGLALYNVRHHLDRPLRNCPELEPWEIQIQAGAELTDVRICEQRDDAGINISGKNRQYCEASAMYWVWKNATAPWVGIGHYRRRLLVSPDMLSGDVDAILPYPYLCHPNAQAQFRRFVGGEIVGAMLGALRAQHPRDYGNYCRCLDGEHHYAYNLLVAKSAVYADFCEWAWGVTAYMEALGIRSIKETRALAYTVEMLTSLYFLSCSDKLNIRHVEKRIYV